MYNRIESVLLDNVTPVVVTSSTDATPIVVTSTAHGLKTGQRVLIYGHATNIAANGIYMVGAVTANTFSLLDEVSGANVAGSGAGAGSGGYCLPAPAVLQLPDFARVTVQIATSGTATLTVEALGSQGVAPSQQQAAGVGQPNSARADFPNFGATVGYKNPIVALATIDKTSGATIAGGTGYAASGADIVKLFDVDVQAQSIKYFTVIPTAWTQGAITLKALVHTEL